MDALARELVLNIYDTVADWSAWPAVLDRVAALVDARGCIVFELARPGTDNAIAAPLYSAAYDEKLLRRYLAHFGPWEWEDQVTFEAHALAADGIELIDDSVLADDDAAFLQRPNVRLLRRYGVGHRAACLLNKDDRSRGRFSVQLGADRGRLTAAQRQSLSPILPHLAKALDLSGPAKQLAAERQALVAAMDRLRIGIGILDRHGRLAHANTEFQRQQERHRVFQVADSGRLSLRDAAGHRQFARLTADAASHGRFGGRPRKEAIVTDNEGTPGALCIEVSPLARAADLSDGAWQGAVVYSLDTTVPLVVDGAALQAVFGLTQTEAALAASITEGWSNKAIAERRERSVETVNAQVKSLLAKTRCANRTQLVRLLSRFGTSDLIGD